MWSIDKTNEGEDLVWSGPETGIAPSALKGNANLQNVNITTQPGAVMASFEREVQTQKILNGATSTPIDARRFNLPSGLLEGSWIQVTKSTVSGITAASARPKTTVSADCILAGGGGAGGNAYALNTCGGGGGGGSVRPYFLPKEEFAQGAYEVKIGAGGKAVFSSNSTLSVGQTTSVRSAIPSTFITLSVSGGVRGGSGKVDEVDGQDSHYAGAGGGGNAGTDVVGDGGDSTEAGDGGDAGTSLRDNTIAGGGGGAGTVFNSRDGRNATTNSDGVAVGGRGGNSTIISLANVGGGGGGAGKGGGGAGGLGGGGAGNDGSVSNESHDGEPGTGGGGGGAGRFFEVEGQTWVAGGNGGSGYVKITYVTDSAYCVGGETYTLDGKTTHIFKEDGIFEVGWVDPGGIYFVYDTEPPNNPTEFKLSEGNAITGQSGVLTHGTTGMITFDTYGTVGRPIAKATELYDGKEYKYYILDDNGNVWIHIDKGNTLKHIFSWTRMTPIDYSSLKIKAMNVINGWLMLFTDRYILATPTGLNSLAEKPLFMHNGWLSNPFFDGARFAYVGAQGTLLYTDGNFIGEIFPTTSLVSGAANIQSYCKYTTSSTDIGIISNIYSGSIPYVEGPTRIPAVFFTAESITGNILPDDLVLNRVYYIDYNITSNNFKVYESLTDRSEFGELPLDIRTGAEGPQFFNTFFPIGADAGAGGKNPLVQFSPQRVNLPSNESAQSLVEIGNNILIGCQNNIIYPWNQVDATPSDIITLPESDVKILLNVNNQAYIFAGDKGNVYISDNTISSLTLKVPDYTAGIPGDPNSYIEPTFKWGDAIFCRGRVYFSVLDEAKNKPGNCGGIWSFVPSENIDPSQDVGLALRLESQSSYGNYNGYAPILINDEQQHGKSPKYYSGWQNNFDPSVASYGIDATPAVERPAKQYIVETDLLATGTQLAKRTFSQLEFKMVTPVGIEKQESDSVELQYRTNPTGVWEEFISSPIYDETFMSGYYQVEFQKTQWLQIRAIVTVPDQTSFLALKEIRLR